MSETPDENSGVNFSDIHDSSIQTGDVGVNVVKGNTGSTAVGPGAQAGNTVTTGPISGNTGSSINIAGGDLTQNILPPTLPAAPSTPHTPADLPLDSIPTVAPLPAHSRMTFTPSETFVGREDDFKAIAASLQAGETTVVTALTGLGGVGKTQLAIEFAHRYGHYFPGGVYWLSFAQAENVESEVAACLDANIDGLLDHNQGLLALKPAEKATLIRERWTHATPRLLVFDNCEDPALLKQWRPTTGGCRVLVTARRTDWGRGITTRPLDTLPRDKAIALLREFRPTLAATTADALAATVGDLPLALHLVGSYLAAYNDPAECVLTELQQPDLLNHPALTARGLDPDLQPLDREFRIGKAFALSYERLNPADATDVLALRLLTRAALFAPGEPIPTEVLNNTLGKNVDPHDAADARHRLLSVGLLETSGDDAVKLHRLLAAYACALPATQDDPAPLADVERVLIDEAYDRNMTRLPAAMTPILPHLRHAAERAFDREDADAATLLNNLGYYLQHMAADYLAARLLYERALAITERLLGPDHPSTATSLNNLAALLSGMGDYPAARPLYERALAIRERVLGPDHPDTATSLNNLAELYRTEGRYSHALPLYERALAIKERVFGPDHPSTATSLNNLAALLNSMGDTAAARPLYERALAIDEKAYGPDHPEVATDLSNLALLLHNMGDYAAARPLYERALAIHERVLGPDHPDTARSLNNLAALLEDMGDYPAARPLFERALSITERVLGPDHPHTGISAGNLAGVYEAMGEYDRAVPLRRRALEIHEKALGEDHPYVATGLNNLALLLDNMGEYAAARPLFERALAIRERVLGPDHPLTATSLNNLALLMDNMRDTPAARPLYERALAIRERVLGPDHPSTAYSLHNLGAFLFEQGEAEAALPLMQRAVAIRVRVLGEGHPNTTASRGWLRKIEAKLGGGG